MKSFAACLFVAAVALAAALAPLSAAGERVQATPTAGVDILVNGAAVPMYTHDGRWYVEALRGREYEIRLRNPYPVRVAVALSVDGLNTIDARHTTATDARKWVIEPFDTITIRGWQTSQVLARRFEFTTESASYGQALGQTANLGVISAVFFKERVPAPSVENMAPTVPRGFLAAPDPSAPAKAAREGESSRADGTSAADARRQRDDYAATGMGRTTDHAVRTVHLDLETAPVQTVRVRYEFRPQLVRLGILPRSGAIDRLHDRDNAQGFEPEFCPIPRRD